MEEFLEMSGEKHRSLEPCQVEGCPSLPEDAKDHRLRVRTRNDDFYAVLNEGCAEGRDISIELANLSMTNAWLLLIFARRRISEIDPAPISAFHVHQS